MITVGAFEAKNRLSELLDRAERGEEVLITRHGRAVARLTSAEAQGRERASAALGRLRAFRRKLLAEGVAFSTEEILSARDEGRR
jgi:prevent-host-death family protein